MCPDRSHPAGSRYRQRGAGLPVALFIITVLSLIVVTMANLQGSGSRSISIQIQSQRAFFAAESGVQTTLARILPDTGNAEEVWGKVNVIGVDNSTISFNTDGLRGCTATIDVERIIGGDGTTTVLVQITSTGSCGTGADEAVRVVEVKVR